MKNNFKKYAVVSILVFSFAVGGFVAYDFGTKKASAQGIKLIDAVCSAATGLTSCPGSKIPALVEQYAQNKLILLSLQYPNATGKELDKLNAELSILDAQVGIMSYGAKKLDTANIFSPLPSRPTLMQMTVTK